MKHIILTGNIGCGKSYISNLMWDKRYEFTEPPYALINMDHEMFTYVYGEGRRFLINNFLTTDKRMVSQMVFNDPQLLGVLNQYYAPHLKRLCYQHLHGIGSGSIIMEFPLLFECLNTAEDRQFIHDNCIVVALHAADDIRYQRAMGRDRKTLDQIRKIDSAQMPQLEKCQLADFVFVNESAEGVEERVSKLIEVLNDQKEKK